MSTATLDTVLDQAKQLTPDEQARLINALLKTARAEQIDWSAAAHDDDDEADKEEQAETWAYLQRALDEDRLSARPLFPRKPEDA